MTTKGKGTNARRALSMAQTSKGSAHALSGPADVGESCAMDSDPATWLAPAHGPRRWWGPAEWATQTGMKQLASQELRSGPKWPIRRFAVLVGCLGET